MTDREKHPCAYCQLLFQREPAERRPVVSVHRNQCVRLVGIITPTDFRIFCFVLLQLYQCFHQTCRGCAVKVEREGAAKGVFACPT